MQTSPSLPPWFAPATRAWFAAAFAAPTAVQLGAWQAVRERAHALVVAPTGSGKTLAAFLTAIDRLMSQPPPAAPDARCRVVYISPLKALAADIERNLRAPLAGISNQLAAAGRRVPQVRVGVRTGDTPAAARRNFGKKPPDILITTPESLFLVLTSGARAGLGGVDTVILDEVHALAGTKRGAHLALSLERLDALLARQAQRIALSATVRPADEVARFVAGAAGPGRRGVTVVQPPASKVIDVAVKLPVEDLADLDRTWGPALPGAAGGAGGAASAAGPGGARGRGGGPAGLGGAAPAAAGSAGGLGGGRVRGGAAGGRPPPVYDAGYGRTDGLADPAGGRAGGRADLAGGRAEPAGGLDLPGDAAGMIRGGSVWPHVHQAVVDHILAHDSTLVFANSRRAAERLAARVNEAYEARLTGQLPDPAAGRASEMVSGGNAAAAVDSQIAMAHHGSMSRERRTCIENQLKAGQLPAVIATSSLELGIDMGAIDLVIQVSAPPSVAAGLQRVGRAGHHVGAVSRGVVYPVFRGDLVPAAVTAARMRAGQIEALHIPANPLDVLAQQIVAMVAMDPWTAPDLARLVRGAAPFEHLGERSFEAVLDMLAGKYPSADFAELKPRIVWDRASGQLAPRPGAAYLARVSGGTIPDRGVYGVYLAGERADPKSAKRVGDLDEEMVYESRVGDTFTLGSSTWRIQQITPNAVYVTPAPGLPGRFPFWHGDAPGRPAELGAAIGAFIRQIGALAAPEAERQLEAGGLDAWAAANLVAYLQEQREATGALPDDRTIVVERFPDELGDTRVMVHSVWGAPVNGAWAAVLAARIQQRYGLDAQVMQADDGIMLRLPDTAPEAQLDLLLPPDDVPAAVTAAVTGTGRFAARFREAAARALVLPRRGPDKRQPLWQQRHRAQQLLEVASKFSDFPLVMEAIRETVQEDFDVAGLTDLMRRLEQRQVRLVEVATPSASPFAGTVAFGYTAQFLYDGDAPLAERRAAALSLDPAMLAELLGAGPASDLAELLDPAVVKAMDAELARTTPERRARSAEALADLLRELGPLGAARLEESTAGPWRQWVGELAAARRVIEIRLAGQTRWAVAEDAAALRDGLGVALPPGLPEALLAPASDPLGSLTRRYMRHHGPFKAADLAADFGLGAAVAQRELDALARQGLARRGRLRPLGAARPGGPPATLDPAAAGPAGAGAGGGAAGKMAGPAGLGQSSGDPSGAGADGGGPGGGPPREMAGLAGVGHSSGDPGQAGATATGQIAGPAGSPGAAAAWDASGSDYCDPEILTRLRRRSLAALRREVEPVEGRVLGAFAPIWQQIGRLKGADGVLAAVEALAGAAVPASAVESLILPARVVDYRPAALDELITAGDVAWVGEGKTAAADGAIRLLATSTDDAVLAEAEPPPAGSAGAELLETLRGGGAFLPFELAERLGLEQSAPELRAALWELVWGGWVTADSFGPLRAFLAGGRTAHRVARRPPRARTLTARALAAGLEAGPGLAQASGRARWAGGARAAPPPPELAARWALAPTPAAHLEALPPERRLAATASALLERYGVVTRGSAASETSFAQLYPVLSALEESGAIRRGYFVEHLGGSQFALPAAPDQLRAAAESQGALALAATDPANPYGAALPWPDHPGTHRPGRVAGGIVLLVDGRLVFYLERGGRTALSFAEATEAGRARLGRAARALAEAVDRGGIGSLKVARLDGEDALSAHARLDGAAEALLAAGFAVTPSGLTKRPPR
jgi:ATP-dependent Lhr-like helicase